MYLGEISWHLHVSLKTVPAAPINQFQSKISVRQLKPTLPWAQETPLAQREDQKGNYPENQNKTQVKKYTVTLFS